MTPGAPFPRYSSLIRAPRPSGSLALAAMVLILAPVAAKVPARAPRPPGGARPAVPGARELTAARIIDITHLVQPCYAPPGLPGSRPRRSDVPRPLQGQAPRRPVEGGGHRLSRDLRPRRGQRSCFLGCQGRLLAR